LNIVDQSAEKKAIRLFECHAVERGTLRPP
jgi:hypothetical protein